MVPVASVRSRPHAWPTVIAKRKRVKAAKTCRRNGLPQVNMRLELARRTHHRQASLSTTSLSGWKEGKEREPEARTEYEIANTVFVRQVGFVYHPTIKMAGASPDGLVGEDGLIEIKCPKLDTHLQYMIDGVDSRRVPAADALADWPVQSGNGSTSFHITRTCLSRTLLLVIKRLVNKP
jgi:hypothetical protein